MEKLYTYQTRGEDSMYHEPTFPWFVFSTRLQQGQLNKLFRDYIYKYTDKDYTVIVPLNVEVLKYIGKAPDWVIINNWSVEDRLSGTNRCDTLVCEERLSKELNEECSGKCPYKNIGIRMHSIKSQMYDPTERFFDSFTCFGADGCALEYKSMIEGHRAVPPTQVISMCNPFKLEGESPASVDFTLLDESKYSENAKKAGFTRHHKLTTCPKCAHHTGCTAKYTDTSCQLFTSQARSRDMRCWNSWGSREDSWKKTPKYCSRKWFNHLAVQRVKELGGISAIRNIIKEVADRKAWLVRPETGRKVRYTILPHITIKDGYMQLNQTKVTAVRTNLTEREMVEVNISDLKEDDSRHIPESVSLEVVKFFAMAMFTITRLSMGIQGELVHWGKKDIALKYYTTTYCGMGKFEFRLRGIDVGPRHLRLDWDTEGRYSNFSIEDYSDFAKHFSFGWGRNKWPKEGEEC